MPMATVTSVRYKSEVLLFSVQALKGKKRELLSPEFGVTGL
jgi:hypothetical protein